MPLAASVVLPERAALEQHGEVTVTIDMTPTDDGYAAIAAMFARSVLDDVRKDRQTDASALLVQALEIAFYLGQRAARPSGVVTPDQARTAAQDLRDRMTVRISTYLPR